MTESKHNPILLAFWKPIGEWEIRIDSAHLNPPYGQKHIHIRRRKKSKGEYSWNIDGSRHDKGKFPKHEKDIQSARKIASEKLKVDQSKLQFITSTECAIEDISIIGDEEFYHILRRRWSKETEELLVLFELDDMLVFYLETKIKTREQDAAGNPLPVV